MIRFPFPVPVLFSRTPPPMGRGCLPPLSPADGRRNQDRSQFRRSGTSLLISSLSHPIAASNAIVRLKGRGSLRGSVPLLPRPTTASLHHARERQGISVAEESRRSTAGRLFCREHPVSDSNRDRRDRLRNDLPHTDGLPPPRSLPEDPA